MMHLRIMLNMYWTPLQLSPFHSASSDYQNKLLASLQHSDLQENLIKLNSQSTLVINIL